MKQRVIACGQGAAGDDGVALAVLEELAKAELPAGVELCVARDGSALMPLLEAADRVLIVDAALGLPPGSLRELSPEQLDREAASALSSHGLSVRQAIDLARSLSPANVAADIGILAVGIERPTHYTIGLSAALAAAVPAAGAAVRAWLERGSARSWETHHA